MTPSNIDIRDAFFDELYNIAKNDPRVILLVADMGAFSLVKFKNDFPDQFINVGIAEQNMVSVAAGLALAGRKVFIYTIIPFITQRCYEQIKIDLCSMNLPVTILGVGPGLTYGNDGPTHHGTQDIAIMRALPEITILNPSSAIMAAASMNIGYKNSGPTYIRIDKGKIPEIYNQNSDFSDGLAELKNGGELTVIATGIMVHQALKAAQELNNQSISTGVVDLYRIKPLNKEKLSRIIDNSKRLATLEENSIVGGIGSAISEFLTDNGKTIPLKRIALPDQHCFESGDRESLLAFYNLDTNGIMKTVSEWIKK
ncbi:MAG: transketolase C-terminal domain-containing protein [Patescibacteria group bacterium]